MLIFAKTAQHYNGKSAKELASQVRILHPDAVVVMPDLSVQPYQGFRLKENYLAGVGTIPICALNPSELTPEGIQKVLDGGFYRHQYQALLRDTHQDDEDPVAERYDNMVQLLKEKGLDSIAQEGKAVVEKLHKMYPPNLYKLEQFFDLDARRKVLRRESEKRNFVTFFWGDPNKRELGAISEKLEPLASSLQQQIDDSYAPPLTDDARDKIDRFIRDRLAQMPASFLKIFNAHGGEVWAADIVKFKESSMTMGSVHQERGSIITLFDEPTVLFEELFHFIDIKIGASANRSFIAKVTGEKQPHAESKKAKDWVDEAVSQFAVAKSPVFGKHSFYSAAPDGNKALELMVNLCHLDRVELSDSRRAALGEMLTKYWPNEKQFTGEPYQGTMRELLADRLPKTFPHYLEFLERAESYANKLEAQSADKPVDKPTITR